VDVPRINTTHCRGQRVGHVIIIHDIVPQVLWLSLCSDVLDEQRYNSPVTIRSVITGNVHQRDLMKARG